MKKIRFGVIGCGHIGKRHASVIQSNSDFELVALCDVRPSSDLNLENFESINFHSSIESLLTEDLDAVAIATPNGFHEQHALLILQSGFHVVIEKPMALTKAGCEKILHTALQKQLQVFCVMQNRYSPPSVWFKNLMESGKLGRIILVQVNCYWNRDDRYYKPHPASGKPTTWHGTKDLDGGILFTQFSHFIDLMFWFFGDICNINSRFINFNHQKSTEFEDTGVVNFEFVNGGIGCINISTAIWDKNLESSITVVAEHGSIKIGGQYMNEVEYCHVKDYTLPQLPQSNPPNDYGPYKGSAANHHFVYENIAEVLHGKKPITTNAYEGLKVVEIIEKIHQSKVN